MLIFRYIIIYVVVAPMHFSCYTTKYYVQYDKSFSVEKIDSCCIVISIAMHVYRSTYIAIPGWNPMRILAS